MDIKNEETFADFCEAMKPFGLVIGSFEEDDYDPFTNWDA